MSRTIKEAYTKSKRFDKTCRNHGGCSYCLRNRIHKHIKKMLAMKQILKDYE